MTTDLPPSRGSWLTLLGIAGSACFAAALLGVYAAFGSQLALAQAADSLSDVFGGAALGWAVRQSRKPADQEHPLGHLRAEPIAALVVAVLAGVLSVEVLRSSVMSVIRDSEPSLEAPLVLAFGGKAVFKAVLAWLARRELRRTANPAIDALRADAQNDVAVSSVAVAGYFGARAGWLWLDPLLAALVAFYVGISGFRLARENIAMLIGESAPEERLAALRDLIAHAPGVLAIDSLMATRQGAQLHVHVEVAVESGLSLIEAHEIGHALEHRLSQEEDVERAVVHVGPHEG